MGLKRKKSIIRYISVPLCLLVMVLNSGLLVVCMGEDGHVSVETITDGCCDSEGSQQESSSAEGAEETLECNDDCGACVDVPLSVEFANSFGIDKKVKPVFSESVFICHLNINDNISSELKFSSEHFIPTPYFSPLSSVILLI
jgi:hypothetical protein